MAGVILSAIIGELAKRSISFLINKWSTTLAPTYEMEDRLQRLLLRVGAIVEEAEGRHISNQTMLRQLNMLRMELYKGYHTLDTFRCRAHEGDNAKENEVDHSFALSRFSPAKRLCVKSGSSGESVKELKRIINNLETVVQDVVEFVILSGRYPCIPRQPYSMYLLLENCMFGRQMEMEHVFKFLFEAHDPYAENNLGVLPIIGPRKVGKSTLVEHVCIHERVRRHFSRIVFFEDDLMGKDMVTLGEGVIKYDNQASGEGRVLIIIELDRDISEELWTRLYSDSISRIARDSKVIITSRSDNIGGLGTTLPLRLQFFTEEAFWYFFKVRVFGSMDVMEHPKLASIAMDSARKMHGCFTGANIIGSILKSNVNVHFWSLAHAAYINFQQKNPFLCSAQPIDPWTMTRQIIIPAPAANRTSRAHFLVLDMYQTDTCKSSIPGHELPAPSDNAAPVVTLQDLMFGNARPQGKFVALAWRSHILPHYSCLFKCELRMAQGVVSRKKRTYKICK